MTHMQNEFHLRDETVEILRDFSFETGITRRDALRELVRRGFAEFEREQNGCGPPEVFISECCGTVVAAGSFDHDDIHETDWPYDAYRSGECPICGHDQPGLREIEAEYAGERR